MKKDLILIGVIVLAIGLTIAYKSTSASPSQDLGETGIDGLSGNIVALGNSAMQGAPCHQMGGQWMGDCTVREINLEVWRYDWSEPTITVKSGELVRIKVNSRDVTHGFGIPQVGLNLQITPGRETSGEFIAPAPGTYAYGCTVMCGPGHRNHQGRLVVL